MIQYVPSPQLKKVRLVSDYGRLVPPTIELANHADIYSTPHEKISTPTAARSRVASHPLAVGVLGTEYETIRSQLNVILPCMLELLE